MKKRILWDQPIEHGQSPRDDKMPLLSHSMRSAWKSCERKVFYRYVAGIETRKPSNAARVIGSAFHTGLESWRKDSSSITPPIMDALTQLATSLEAIGITGDESLIERARLCAYLRGYFERFDGDADRPGKWSPEIELKTVEEIGFLDTLWIDMKGGAWIVEDKTTSMLDSHQPTALLLDEQLLNYALLLRHHMINVVGAIYRQTLKTKKRPHKGESIDKFQERLTADYIADQDNYREMILTFDQTQLNEYAVDRTLTNRDIKSAINHSTKLGDYRRNAGQCLGKFGPCDYLHLCAHRKDDGAQMFKPNGKEPLDGGKFRTEIWGEAIPQETITTDTGVATDDLPDLD